MSTVQSGTRKRKHHHDEEIINSGHSAESEQEFSTVPQLSEFQVQQLEHHTRTLQKSIKYVLENAYDYCEYSTRLKAASTDDLVRFSMKSPLFKLATVIKSKWKLNALPELDAILNNELSLSLKEKSQLKSLKTEEKSVEGMVSSNTFAESSAETKTQYASIEGMPPLPEIRNPELKQRVFIHKSTYTNKSFLNPSEIIGSHNERLEFLGDSVLNHLVTKMIFDRFPDATEGELSGLRSLLVKNSVLTELSLKYGFDKQLKSTINEADLRDGKQKIYADIFEAYIGALTRDGTSQEVIQKWLSQLMEGLIKEYEFSRQQKEPINRDAKTELYSMIGTASSHPVYDIEQMGDGSQIPYIIHCKMGDEVLGRGVAPGNKEAGLRAAMSALKNRELLAKYSHMRLLLDRNESVVKRPSPSPSSDSFNIEQPPSTDGGLILTNINTNKSTFPIIVGDGVPLIVDAKNQLYAKFNGFGMVPEYVYSNDGDNFVCKLIVQGKVLSIGRGSSKKKASQKAASVFVGDWTAFARMIEQIDTI